MATPWTAFYDQVASKVPNAPLNVVQQAIVRAVRDFCRRTLWWEETIAPISTVANQSTYALTEASGQEIIRVKSARLALGAGKDLEPATWQQLKERYGDYSALFGTPDYFIQPTRTTLRLVLTPNFGGTGNVTMTAAIQPSLDAADLDRDDLYAEHESIIALGARAHLLDSHGLAYSSVAHGLELMREFNAKCTGIALERMRGRTGRAPSVSSTDR